jgi:NAD(P)-dependent dehydrogenase (short-subunit alcohol dehydrogenase family)
MPPPSTCHPPYLQAFSLAGKVAFVAGAARGLGLRIAAALAVSGAHVVLNGRDPVALERAVNSSPMRGTKPRSGLRRSRFSRNWARLR